MSQKQKRVQAVIESVYRAGVVGAGGAGFPTHIKLQNHADLVIANGVECEPLLYHDKHLMEDRAEAVVTGLKLAMQATGSRAGVLAIKEGFCALAAGLEKHVKRTDRIRTILVPDYYPAGDEHELVRLVTGLRIKPGDLPLSLGVIVNNVTTLAQVCAAVAGQVVVMRPLSIVGDIAQPVTVEAPLGISFRELLEQTGNRIEADRCILEGGVMMGRPVGLNDVVTKTTTALVIVPVDHPCVREYTISLERQLRMVSSRCIQCQSCQDICPRNMLGHPLRPHLNMRSSIVQGMISRSAVLCSECGLCALVACPAGISPRMLHRHQKAELLYLKGDNKPDWELGDEQSLRPLHRISLGRLKDKIQLRPYDREPERWRGRFSLNTLKILLKQHIGNRTKPVVVTGQEVIAGELLGDIPHDSIGACVHSPLTGQVREMTLDSIVVASSSGSTR
ncbi:4Fe-4S dicluster domain-containing protein [bacterium]|nr:4Fe-4S dicluster domain-containing protein [bacterium]